MPISTNDEDRQAFFNNWHNQWIQPELIRRFGETSIPKDFRIRECLITFPKGEIPRIAFNKEFGWSIENPNLAGGKKLEDMDFNEPIYLHELLSIDTVLPPMINGERVAFMYLYWDGYGYHLFVDFLPNQPDYDPTNDRFRFDGTAIANHLKTILFEQAVGGANVVRERLHQIGLWVATSLLHYPMAKIVERIGAGEFAEARQVLINYCDKDFISQLVESWQPVAIFDHRKPFFNDAHFLHNSGRYHGSISILVGQIEGVITDWLLDVNYYTTDKERPLNKKIKDLRDALDKIPNLLWLYREARNSMLDFLDGEPWLQQFKNWNQSINTAFPSRHVAQHGKYIPDMYNEENSIKLFLLLDTICQFMMFYETRVLGKSINDNNLLS